jgi:hypothetical protein
MYIYKKVICIAAFRSGAVAATIELGSLAVAVKRRYVS